MHCLTKLAAYAGPLAVVLCFVTPATKCLAQTTLVERFDTAEALSAWTLLDADSWQLAADQPRGMLRLVQKASAYTPPHRSPGHIALWETVSWGDFDLKVRVRSTHPDYGHRDVCLFFGWVDPAHFFYVHLGKEPDPHCHQIFVVDGADRLAITDGGEKDAGAPWDDAWHTVRLTRSRATGRIAVYWDGQNEPMLTATDTRFPIGKLGVGSFDDTADFSDLRVNGVAVSVDAAP
ncbi:hypothetical protein [Botrimarina hoheduenensis]|uniref:Laminin G domain protein n=1 Tax=Botrimarina hoheduenensis TaxID=2528000 RepID=A0A5C5W8M6_9BACT|nr:hypothetical protein [Botrimarina hoheduenensis]TWT47246.1 hypothetical protein Pla111_08580 [Botrimarina hoheduenensis]